MDFVNKCISYYEKTQSTLADDIHQRMGGKRFYGGDDLFNILRRMTTCGEWIVKQSDGSNGRHGDIRPRYIAWDGVRVL